jgi:hypothetical protein
MVRMWSEHLVWGGTVTFGRTYFVEVVDYSFGTGSYCCRYITPQFSGQVFYLP